jgi:hypothetical protein
VISAVLALVFLSLTFIPYPSLKALTDTLVADGELESFSPHLYQVLRVLWGIASGILLFVAAWSLFDSDSFARWLFIALRFARRWLTDLKQFVLDLRLLRLSGVELALLITVCGFALVARLLLINRPIEYDEAYTVMAFAHSPFRILVSDYHVPNNHVFHTILVRIAVLLLGSQPWQIRMPTLISGMLLIPFVFWLARTLYSRQIGYMSAAIVAFLPHMVKTSVSARGYILISLLTVMAFLLTCYLFQHRNIFAWSLLAVLCAIGFYTIPIMLYPFSFLALWIMMHTPLVMKDQYTQAVWILHLVAVGLLVVVLTLLLYSPILLNSDAKDFTFGNSMLESQDLQALLGGIPELAGDIIAEWVFRMALGLSVILIIGILLSLLRIYDHRSQRIHTGVALLFSVLVLILIQRPQPARRIWLWIIPFAAIWASAGLGLLLQLFPKNRPGKTLNFILIQFLIIGLAANGIQSSRLRSNFENPAVEEVANILVPRLTSKSLVVASSNADAYIWYYLYLEGDSGPRFFNPHKNRPFNEIFVVARSDAPNCQGGYILKVLQIYGPDLSLLDIDRMSEVAQVDDMKVCWVPSLQK